MDWIEITRRRPNLIGASARHLGRVAAVLFALASASCVTVKPTQRSVLADPIMQFEGDPQASAQLRHAIDNREGSYGGGGVSGGGCGCN
jgi:hypothetical protein